MDGEAGIALFVLQIIIVFVELTVRLVQNR